jgi:hypothetical protein
MTVAHGVDRAGSGELLLGELADRLQQPIAGMTSDPFGDDQGLAH